MTAVPATPATPWPQLAAAGVAAAVVGGGLVAASLTPVGGSWAPIVLDVLLFAVVAACGLWLAVVDAREHRLPNAIVLPLYAAVSVLLIAQAIATADLGRLLTAAIAGMLGFLAFFLLGLGGGVGFGDVKLAGVLALYLGSLTWSAPVVGFVLAFVLAAPHTVALLVLHRRGALKHRLPFGPYLVAGALIAAAWFLTHPTGA
jgi:leader peptidase (prepilin peptidase)/N-methyltransferase